MKKVFLSKSILAAGVLGAIVSANAAINDPKPYIGANLDYNMYNWTSELKKNLSSIKKKSFGLSPIVGVKLMDNVGVEFGYSFIKKVKWTDATSKGASKLKNIYLDVLGSMPVAEQFEVMGGLGLGKISIKDNQIKNKFSWRAKLAGQYNVNSNIAARLTATYQKANNKGTLSNNSSIKLMKNMTSIGLGVFYTF